MSEERQAERDSQLSAMFDDELPAGECELLARRLSRDEALRAQWSRYSMIGAALRAERGVALHDRVAQRVQSAVSKEISYGEAGAADAVRTGAAESATPASGRRWLKFGYPVAGASIAAGVAAVSIFWLQGAQDPVDLPVQASNAAPTTIVLTPEPDATPVAIDTAPPRRVATSSDYSTPAPSSTPRIAPPARLANYVVAHSEYSGPITRRMALMGIVGAEEIGPEVETAAPEGTRGTEDGDAP
jgi:sigma-E factor negative regulatory protein RseA